jgi:hypothetical protein
MPKMYPASLKSYITKLFLNGDLMASIIGISFLINNMSSTYRTKNIDGDPRGLNPDLSVEMKDNSIGEESRCSWPDYNHPGMLRLSD